MIALRESADGWCMASVNRLLSGSWAWSAYAFDEARLPFSSGIATSSPKARAAAEAAIRAHARRLLELVGEEP